MRRPDVLRLLFWDALISLQRRSGERSVIESDGRNWLHKGGTGMRAMSKELWVSSC